VPCCSIVSALASQFSYETVVASSSKAFAAPNVRSSSNVEVSFISVCSCKWLEVGSFGQLPVSSNGVIAYIVWNLAAAEMITGKSKKKVHG
jgi:hypothetical protein